MQTGLVSVITPCYNTGAIVHRLLDSILMQDYPSIEMFCINDGSTDNTEEVVKSYIPKFEAKGYNLTYIYQENSGQSVAVNKGLKLVNGEFLMWPDSDDYYCDGRFVSMMVKKMQSTNYAMGRCRVRFVDDEEKELGLGVINDSLISEDQFYNYTFGQNGVAYPPIAFILDLKLIDQVIPGREIYSEKAAGQNWQLMMPMSYKKKCFYIETICANVLERDGSHSRGQFIGYERTIEKVCVYERTILGTLDRMRSYMGEDYRVYYDKVQNAYSHGRMIISILNYKKNKACHYQDELQRRAGSVSLMDRIACMLCTNKYTFVIARIIMKLTHAKL